MLLDFLSTRRNRRLSLKLSWNMKQKLSPKPPELAQIVPCTLPTSNCSREWNYAKLFRLEFC